MPVHGIGKPRRLADSSAAEGEEQQSSLYLGAPISRPLVAHVGACAPVRCS